MTWLWLVLFIAGLVLSLVSDYKMQVYLKGPGHWSLRRGLPILIMRDYIKETRSEKGQVGLYFWLYWVGFILLVPSIYMLIGFFRSVQ